MGTRWLIVADDVTGAADCAIAFAKQGIASTVSWGDGCGHLDAQLPVFSYDANSRTLPPAEAASRHRQVLGKFLDRGTNLFKKIDSTLRGQPAAETAATIEDLRKRLGSAFGIFAPAFPATGRTTENGRVHVGGLPLEQAEVWQRDHSYPTADLVDVLAMAGVAGEKVPLSIIRGGAETLRAAFTAIAAKGEIVAVCDALTQNDLDRIAEASLPAPESVFFIGSAGLAHALAAAMPRESLPPIKREPTTNGSLVVVGSLAGASRAAARNLVASNLVRHVPVEPQILLDDSAGTERAALVSKVIAGLDAGDDVLVEILMNERPNLAIGPRLADGLAETLKPASRHMGGLAATGGETAAAVFAHFGVSGIRLVDEIEPGVSLGLTLGDISVPVVTKAGAFGDQGSLTRIAERLRLIRQEGILA